MLRHAERASKPEAFTLAELIVVIVILAVAAGMVVPYAISTSDLAVVSAARILASDLEYAQNVAITTQQWVKLSFDTSTESYSLANASGTLDHPINKAPYVVSFPSLRGFEGVNVVSAGFGGAPELTFDVLGSPDNGGSTVLQAGAHTYVVSVASATGKVTVSPAGS
jgi:general secretion pathway protein H